jgi:tRNA pseudouridine55 synthase
VTAASGLVIVDKPAGWTSHDVVARIRRLAGTRRVGHAGTLDPMATGVLVVGVEKATRLLGYLTLARKQYTGTIRLGQSTDTDDADGQIVAAAPVTGIAAAQISAAARQLTGQIQQVPPGVSAVKVAGRRAYQLARAGQAPRLAARTVTVEALDILAVRPGDDVLDLDVDVTCSSGTYIRAIARDLGAALGTGGHLTALRRTRSGAYLVSAASTLDQLAAEWRLIPLAQAAADAFPRLDLAEDQARLVAHGGRLPAPPGGPPVVGPAVVSPAVPGQAAQGQAAQGQAAEGQAAEGPGEEGPAGQASAGEGPAAEAPIAAFGPDGSLIALLARQPAAPGDPAMLHPLAVFVP